MRLRKPLRTIAVGLGAIAFITVSGFAHAQDEEEDIVIRGKGSTSAKKKRKVVVVYEGDGNAPEPLPAAQVGDPDYEIEAYLRSLGDRVRYFKDKLKQAKRAGDFDEADALVSTVAKEKSFESSEKDRLTTNEPGLIAGGAVLTGVGSLAFVGAIIALAGWGISAIDGNSDDEWGWASLGCLVGGIVGVGAGAPMLAVGVKRHPRGANDAWIAPTLQSNGFAQIPAGATLSWSF